MPQEIDIIEEVKARFDVVLKENFPTEFGSMYVFSHRSNPFLRLLITYSPDYEVQEVDQCIATIDDSKQDKLWTDGLFDHCMKLVEELGTFNHITVT